METFKVFFDKESDICTFKFYGVLEYKDILLNIKEYYSGTPAKYAIWDFTETDPGKLQSSEIKQLANYVIASSKLRKGGLAALIVPEPIRFGLARMFTAYADITHKDKEAVKIMMFDTKDGALLWIQANKDSK